MTPVKEEIATVTQPEFQVDNLLQPGKQVYLNVPENPRLHGQLATVMQTTEYGALVSTRAAATSEFRAGFDEMVFDKIQVQPDSTSTKRAIDQGYTGNCCVHCGSTRMKRNGTCELCEECGSTSGCS